MGRGPERVPAGFAQTKNPGSPGRTGWLFVYPDRRRRGRTPSNRTRQAIEQLGNCGKTESRVAAAYLNAKSNHGLRPWLRCVAATRLFKDAAAPRCCLDFCATHANP